MKVLLIDVNCKFGSTGKIVYDLYKELINDGYSAKVCYGRGKKIKEKDIFKFGINVETYFHALLTRVTGLTGCFSYLSTKRLLRFIKKYAPDIVHLHELHGYFVNIKPVINYLKRNNIKTIWTFHCDFMFTGRCGCSYSCEGWKNGCGNCPNMKEYPTSWFFDHSRHMLKEKISLFRDFDNLTIVTPSHWLATKTKESVLNNINIKVIYNGIDTELFCPRLTNSIRKKYNLQNKKVVLAVAPNIMQKMKGGDWVLQLASKMLNDNIIFIMIGVEDDTIITDKNVIALRKTENQDELAQYYSLADVFLLTSKQETFSLVCVESLACGTPIVGFMAGGPETIIPPELGQFVVYGDLEALQEAVEYRLNSQNIAKECRKYAVDNFNEKLMYENYKRLYLDYKT